MPAFFNAIMDQPKREIKIALAHHWMTGMRGGEKVLEQLVMLFPKAPIYTLFAIPSALSPRLRQHPIHTSFLQSWPGSLRWYRHLLPFYPLALSRFRIEPDVRLLLTNDASIMKGIRRPGQLPQVCHCLSPPRYLWDMQETYLAHTSGMGIVGRQLLKGITPWLRNYDREASAGVTQFIAISRFVRDRIQQYYQRPSIVIYPPVAIKEIPPGISALDYYLVISELVSYKRIDLAIAAFNRLQRRLVVIGNGPEERALRRLAGPSIEFLGHVSDQILWERLASCRAFIFPGVEDFGITAVEAQSAGKPVIAYQAGGVAEIVIEGKTGLFFREQTVDSLFDAVKRFEAHRPDFSANECHKHAAQFGEERFRKEIKNDLHQQFPQLFTDYAWPV